MIPRLVLNMPVYFTFVNLSAESLCLHAGGNATADPLLNINNGNVQSGQFHTKKGIAGDKAVLTPRAIHT